MNRGGLETMLMNYYRQMDRSQVQFDFMVHRDEQGHYDEEIKRLGGIIYRMPQIRPGNYRSYFQLLDNFFRSHKEYEIVHSHINENSSFVLRAAKKANIPCRIAHSHTSDLGFDYKFLFRIYARMGLRNNPNVYFACSQNAGKWLFGKKALQSGAVSILNNAIDLDRFRFNNEIRENVRRGLGLTNELVVGHVGRFHKSKNHHFLIEVFESIQKKDRDAVLLLVGEGDQRTEIERKVKEKGLSNCVRFLGVRGDIPNIMYAMDLFLFPSFFEGAPVVLVEAQAAGLTCFVSDTITQDINITNKVQFLSLKELPEVWAEKMINTPRERIDTTDMLERKGYSIRDMATNLMNFYQSQIIRTQ